MPTSYRIFITFIGSNSVFDKKSLVLGLNLLNLCSKMKSPNFSRALQFNVLFTDLSTQTTAAYIETSYERNYQTHGFIVLKQYLVSMCAKNLSINEFTSHSLLDRKQQGNRCIRKKSAKNNFFSHQTCDLHAFKATNNGWNPRSKILIISVVSSIQTTKEQYGNFTAAEIGPKLASVLQNRPKRCVIYSELSSHQPVQGL